jgi:hypothetical protein
MSRSTGRDQHQVARQPLRCSSKFRAVGGGRGLWLVLQSGHAACILVKRVEKPTDNTGYGATSVR